MDLLELLKSTGALDQLSKQLGVGNNQVEEVVKIAVPKITDGINKNTSTEEGLNSFLNAAKDHKDAPLENMLKNIKNVDTDDGMKILGHIFGDSKPKIEQELSATQGLSSANIGTILSFLTPILMGMVGRQTKNKNLKEINKNQKGGLLDSILGDNSAITDIAKSFLGNDKDKNIVGDILGGLFKK